jgi:hypothetical protein
MCSASHEPTKHNHGLTLQLEIAWCISSEPLTHAAYYRKLYTLYTVSYTLTGGICRAMHGVFMGISWKRGWEILEAIFIAFGGNFDTFFGGNFVKIWVFCDFIFFEAKV